MIVQKKVLKTEFFIIFYIHFSLDATNDIFYMGRMVNDAVKGDALQNSDMKIVVVDDIPHLCLFASRDIYENEEIRFDYGVPSLPWRKVGIS